MLAESPGPAVGRVRASPGSGPRGAPQAFQRQGSLWGGVRETRTPAPVGSLRAPGSLGLGLGMSRLTDLGGPSLPVVHVGKAPTGGAEGPRSGRNPVQVPAEAHGHAWASRRWLQHESPTGCVVNRWWGRPCALSLLLTFRHAAVSLLVPFLVGATSQVHAGTGLKSRRPHGSEDCAVTPSPSHQPCEGPCFCP